ncbi:MAG TPA: hypothetical protein VMK13_13425, partial [Streptosporangiaceae bacterium]|nr:hypothetical protein [Streptosporangiaceae bacterium]
MSSFAPGIGIDSQDGAAGTTAAGRRALAVRWAGAAVPCCYLLAGIVVTWRLWADPASRVVAGNPHDADLYAWFMRYAAMAVRHGRLPALITTGMNAPQGVNLMWNTPLLLPAVLLAPVTGLLGPQVSLTVLTTAGFAGSAAAMFWVLRRWRVSIGAAALSGAVYGFSPALLQSAMSHYNLQLAILAPLIIDAGLRLAVGQPTTNGDRDGDRRPPAQRTRIRWLGRLPAPVRAGTWLGLLVAAELFISEEIALSVALAGLLLVAGLTAARPRAAARRLGPAAAGLVVAAAVTLALAGPALRTQFYGPLTQHGALFPPDYYVNDLTSFVTPQSSLFFRTAASAAAAARYQGGAAEYLAYLGWPLIIMLGLATLGCWGRPAGRALALTFVLLEVFSLGGHPLVSGTAHPAVSLPWHWIERLPVVATALPDRLSILADGAAAALLALGIDAVRARLPARGTAEPSIPADRASTDAAGLTARLRQAVAGRAPAAVLAVAVLACLPLLPRPLPVGRTLPLPAGWSQVFTRLQLAPGAQVLAAPVPVNYLTPVMRWQADTGEPTAMIGGYFIGPGQGGQAYLDGAGVKPAAWYLDQLWAAGLPPESPFASAARLADLPTATAAGPAPEPAGPGPAQLAADLRSWQPSAVVADAALGSPLGR